MKLLWLVWWMIDVTSLCDAEISLLVSTSELDEPVEIKITIFKSNSMKYDIE